jgi:hypothetical protein
MNKLAHSLPLQDMIKNVLNRATEKLAEDQSQDKKVKKLLAYEKQEHGHVPTPSEEEAEKRASAGSTEEFIQKLASTCDFIANNLDSIGFPARGLLQKVAEEAAVGPGLGAGALPVSKSIGGKQVYRKVPASSNNSAGSQAGSSLSTGGLPGGKTQMDNDLHDAPGGGGISPTGKYPEKGPLVAGPTIKQAAAAMRRRLLSKLAGEDVLKANISAGTTGQTLTTTDATQASPRQSGDAAGGFGNQARKLIASNSAAINATKREAKGPVKTQLKEVLDEPALSAKKDPTLKDNLRNTGKAGVKIAAAKEALQKIAQAGCQCGNKGGCSYCHLKSAIKGSGSEKTAMMNGMGGMGAMKPPGPAAGMMGGARSMSGMPHMADAGAGADGCNCGGAGECRVCKLKATLSAAQGDGNATVEKDSGI